MVSTFRLHCLNVKRPSVAKTWNHQTWSRAYSTVVTAAQSVKSITFSEFYVTHPVRLKQLYWNRLLANLAWSNFWKCCKHYPPLQSCLGKTCVGSGWLIGIMIRVFKSLKQRKSFSKFSDSTFSAPRPRFFSDVVSQCWNPFIKGSAKGFFSIDLLVEWIAVTTQELCPNQS